MKSSWVRWAVVVALCFVSLESFSYPRALQDLNKKAEIKRDNRWTIYDWLSAKSQFKLMDQWLAANRSDTLFETLVSGSFVDAEDDLGGSSEATRGSASLFYSIFGVGGLYEDRKDRGFNWEAFARLRLLGTSQQNSHLAVSYGVKHFNQSFSGSRDKLSSPFVDGQLSIYLMKVFGLRSRYQHFFSDSTEVIGLELNGRRVEYGVFVDISALQLSVDYFDEELEGAGGVSFSDPAVTGWVFSLTLYL